MMYSRCQRSRVVENEGMSAQAFSMDSPCIHFGSQSYWSPVASLQ